MLRTIPRLHRQSRVLAAGLIAAIVSAALALSVTGPAVASTTTGPTGTVIDAGYLKIGMDSTGEVVSLVDSRNGQDYIAAGHGTAPLVSLMVDGQQVKPTALSVGSGNTLVFTNAAAGVEVDVAVHDDTTYSTFEVTKATAPSGADIQTLLWGPLPLALTGSLAEAAGVASNGAFAVGMKVLTDRTEGGWPRGDKSIGWGSEAQSNPYGVTVGGLEEWSVGAKTSWGSLLRAFTFDYTKTRDRLNDSGYRIPVGPLPGTQGLVVGSKVALYGAAPEVVPTILSSIAIDQNLPYPTIDGQWQKTAQATSKSFMIYSDLGTSTISQADTFAKAAGIDTVYDLAGSIGGPWTSGGHFGFTSAFGGSDAGAASLVASSEAAGVNVGVHTLSDFITPNDSYAAPSLSPDLAYGQSTTLTRALALGDTTAYLSSCGPLAGGVRGSLLVIDSEVVSYTASSTVGSDCVVTGLSRGVTITDGDGRTAATGVAAAHASGAEATRLPLNAYSGLLGGLNIIDSVATRFATIWNTTGIKAMSFDGLESASESGWGSYGMARLVNGTFRQQKDPSGFISETSRMGSNVWDGLSRISWGELSGSRASLLNNNAYYQANFMPGGIGWISLSGSSKLQDIEDALALGAGLNEGADFRSSVSTLASGGQNAQNLLSAIKQWETARNLGAFTSQQRAGLRDISRHWHLSVVTPGKAWTLQEVNASGTPVGAAQSVVTPTPAFVTTYLPGITSGKLYEAMVSTNVPTTIRYTVTAGALPTGLTLNKDTGGITGIPTSAKASSFTITGTGSAGAADATQAFIIAPATEQAQGPLDLSSSVNNVGATSQSAVGAGNFDGAHNSYSAEQLAAAGATPGSTITTNGTSFSWPGAAAGAANNVRGSATIQGSGRAGTALAFLGAEAPGGPALTSTVTVNYTDGTTATATLGFPNWVTTTPNQFGAAPAITTVGRNLPSGYGDTTRQFQVFSNQIGIDPSKTIQTVTLPSSTAIHIFALTVVGAPAGTKGALDLSPAVNNVGVTSQSAVSAGNFDGAGNSYSAEQLAAAGVTPGSTVTANGVSFSWPAVGAGAANNVQGPAVIAGGGRGGSTLAFLGASSTGSPAAGTVVVTYTDGSTTQAAIGFPNWVTATPTQFGATPAISTTGRNLSSGYGDTGRTFQVFSNQITIDPSKVIKTVAFPSDPTIHIFAVSVK